MQWAFGVRVPQDQAILSLSFQHHAPCHSLPPLELSSLKDISVLVRIKSPAAAYFNIILPLESSLANRTLFQTNDHNLLSCDDSVDPYDDDAPWTARDTT